jgi:glycosyltransferase involved in cell wall biosynthesis
MNTPLVTCLQLSYGRPQLSVEAVECFLQQTYENKKLIIINTHPSPVYFDSNYENIEVHNIKPLSHLSNVYRFGMELITSDYFCIWDDDDLYMPWHIQDRVNILMENPSAEMIGHTHCIYSCDGEIRNFVQNAFVSQHLYKNKVNFPNENIACWDMDWANRPWKQKTFTFPIKPSYVYRWGTGEDHISGLGGEEGQQQGYMNNIERKSKIKFDFPWVPSWRKNYVQLANEFMQNNKL